MKTDLWAWLFGDTLKTLFIAVIGGISVYYIPKLFSKFFHSRKHILFYQLDDFGNSQGRRRISHSFGKIAEDKDASNKKAWEHMSTRIDPGEATCYGPYTKELALRGKYKAKFRIKVCGIRNKKATILTLDVAYGIIGEGGKIETIGLPIVEKDLRDTDFKEGEYKDFNLIFDYDGQLLIEFM